MTDDEVLEALDARFAGVETRLPPRRLAGVAEAPVVARRAGSSVRGSGLALASLAAVVAIATFAVAGRPTGPGLTAQSSAGPSASPSISSAPSAQPTPGLEVIRGAYPEYALMERMGWGVSTCSLHSYAMRLAVDGEALDQAIEEAGVDEGSVSIQGRVFWVGPTAESAAIGFGAPIVAIASAGSEAWVVVDGVGFRLMREVTPKGRTAWWLGNSVRACPEPSSSPTLSQEPSLQILRGPVGGDTLIWQERGWGACGVGADIFIVLPDGEAIDRAIDGSGIVDGPVVANGGVRVWVAPTAERAAIGFDSPILAIGPADTWIVQGRKARQLVSFETPKGRTFWMLMGSVAPCPGNGGPG